MGIYETDTEELRKKLLNEIYAGAFAGFGCALPAKMDTK